MQPALADEQTSYLVFSLRGSLYGVPARAVVESLWLPELTPMAEEPGYLAGLMNVRGRVVPVTDLAVLLGLPPRRYTPSDNVILLETGGLVSGVLVDQVREVCTLPAAAVEPPPGYAGRAEASSRFVHGVAALGDRIVALLDLSALKQPARLPELPAGAPGPPPPADRGFSPDASAEERDLFHRRALQLRQPPESLELIGLVPLAVVGIGGEYYGLELAMIREFTGLEEITPVPCCPPHIVGNLNLRGEVLTLIDIRGVLNVSADEAPIRECAVVVESGDMRLGVLVDEIIEVINLRPAEIASVPTALKLVGDEYLKGTARYGGKTLGLLDLQAVLRWEQLAVNEEV